MIRITVNSEPHPLAGPTTVAELLHSLGLDTRRVAVEVNRDVIPRDQHSSHRLADGDQVELVTLVGGGAGEPVDSHLTVGPFRFQSRLFTGTGKYASYELMRDCLA